MIEWRKTDYPFIEASSHGYIRSLYYGTIYTSAPNSRGYHVVTLHVNGKQVTGMVHRLVCEAFHGKSDLTVDHINCNKDDNSAVNLRWISQADNAARATNGDASSVAKLTSEKARQIRKDCGTLTQRQQARKYNVSDHCISSVLINRTWKNA